MSELVEVQFEDGSHLHLSPEVAGRVRGRDGDGDPLIALSCDPDRPTLRPDGAEYLIPLTPCCDATSKGSCGATVCRVCYEVVDDKYGSHGELVVAVKSADLSGPKGTEP
ncbi:hypothetical protein AB0A63_31225 [Lentzea sp. NPDC042327]|uniref:hypothetical protein n=1 Tax=Lentzea sp. NPDC042327 TaxID=3154801 RepID=UPI003408696D